VRNDISPTAAARPSELGCSFQSPYFEVQNGAFLHTETMNSDKNTGMETNNDADYISVQPS